MFKFGVRTAVDFSAKQCAMGFLSERNEGIQYLNYEIIIHHIYLFICNYLPGAKNEGLVCSC